MRIRTLIVDNNYKTIKELADEMNINYNTLKSKMFRCNDNQIIINDKLIKIIR